MNNTMEYKGYVGSVEFSEEDALFFGKVLGVRALISYEGENARDLVEDFHSAVDDYLERYVSKWNAKKNSLLAGTKSSCLEGAFAFFVCRDVIPGSPSGGAGSEAD